jgi:anhydro-N-acetylmuramic acid kinase
VNQYLCQKLVQHPYFSLALPKSTGLEEFGPQWVNSIISSSPDISTEDLLATLCSVIAYGVSSSLQSTDVTPQEIYLCGGGRHNLALRSALVEAMPFAEILDYSQLGYDPDLREAVAFAILGDAFLLGETSTWPTTTGARKSSILGNLVRPRP